MNGEGFMRGSIFQSYLAFSIRTQVGHQRSMLTDKGKFLNKPMSKIKGKRNKCVALVGGITEHHALVAGTLLLRS